VYEKRKLESYFSSIFSESVSVYTDGGCHSNGREDSRAGIGVFWGHDHIKFICSVLASRLNCCVCHYHQWFSTSQPIERSVVFKFSIPFNSNFFVFPLDSGNDFSHDNDFGNDFSHDFLQHLYLVWLCVFCLPVSSNYIPHPTFLTCIMLSDHPHLHNIMQMLLEIF